MGRTYLLSIVLLGGITQCCKFTNFLSAETDRAALERAERVIGQDGVPPYELFASTIADVRNRFGDVAADILIERVLKRIPDYAPGHLARAESLFRHGRQDAAVIEGRLALECSPHTSGHAQLRAIHSFLAQAYQLVGDMQQVREHRRWLDANR